MDLARALAACACAASLCTPGFACVLVDRAPLPKELRTELNQRLSEMNVPADAVTDTYDNRHGVRNPWSAAAVVDIGASPDETYRRRHIRCDYNPGAGWNCKDEIARYIREDQQLIQIDERLSAADARLIIRKIRSLVGAPSRSENNVPLQDFLVADITRLYIERGEIRAYVAGGCGTVIRFAGQCRESRICNLRYVDTWFIM